MTRFASLDACLDTLLATAVAMLGLARSSVWLFERDGAQIHCFRASGDSGSKNMAGERIQRISCPAYFDALHSEMVIDAGDAERDSRTCELTEYYLKPLGVRALLDAPVRIFGSQVGVLCLETAEQRDWQLPDKNFAAALGIMVGLALEHAELLRAREQIQRSLEFDLDTGLANGRHFERELSLALAAAQPPDGWVARLELGQYSALRASLSESAMRELYRRIAEQLRARVPSLIELAHVGDSEFSLFSTNVDAARLLAGIRSAFETPIELEGQSLLLAPICGLRRLDCSNSESAADLMRDAETAMHEAREGVGDVVVHSPLLSADRQQSLATEQAIRRAVQANAFFLMAQPMIDLSSGRLLGVEALIRWRQSDGSIVSPSEFLQVLLDTGLIVPVSRQLLPDALRKVRRLQRQLGRADLGLSFNLSAPELMQLGLADMIRTEMQALSFPRGQLAIELTESAVIADQDGIARALTELRSIGCRVHLDDFGTGYSSLNHMRQLPFDAIKIDRSFLFGALTSVVDRRLIGMLVGLSRELGRDCVAEGVADSAHLSLALELGANIGQGFMIARPMPLEEIDVAWLNAFEAKCRTDIEVARSEGVA